MTMPHSEKTGIHPTWITFVSFRAVVDNPRARRNGQPYRSIGPLRVMEAEDMLDYSISYSNGTLIPSTTLYRPSDSTRRKPLWYNIQ